MYSVDPKVYDAYKKSEKKSGGESKKLRQVRIVSAFTESLDEIPLSLLSRFSLTCLMCDFFSHNSEILLLNCIFSFHNNMQWL